jgi:hypothetical protein
LSTINLSTFMVMPIDSSFLRTISKVISCLVLLSLPFPFFFLQ